MHKTLKGFVLLVTLFPGFGLTVTAQSQPSASLDGIVSSESEGQMEGVLVTAKKSGEHLSVTVVSDDKGRYVFPAGRIGVGTYTLGIRAVGYELANPISVEVGNKLNHTNIRLVKTKNLASQLTAGEWLMSVPGNDKQKNALFRCDQCHSLDKPVESTYDAKSWLKALEPMQLVWLGNSTFSHPVAPPAMRPIKERPIDPELAAYLSTINLSNGRTTWSYELKTYPRPKGANTKVIITEYELPRPDSMPHDVAIDSQGNVWYSDFQSGYLGRLDPATGKTKEWTLPLLRPGNPRWTLALELDKDGNPWLPRFYQGCSVTMLDVRTEKFHTFSPPPEENGEHVFCSHGNVAANGMVWFSDVTHQTVFELDPTTGKVRSFDAFPPGTPKHSGPSPLFYFGITANFAEHGAHESYGSAVDSDGDPIYCDMGGSTIAVLNHETGQVTLYPTPTPDALPRRGSIDSRGRFWFGEWAASQLGMFDPKTKEIKEWRPPTPWSGLYRATADDKGDAWAAGMTTDFVYRLNPSTGEWREYLVPTLGGEMRDIKIHYSGKREEVWAPLVHAGKIEKVEPLD